MTDLRPFAFEDHLVRVIEREGEPWFVGRDVCEALEIKNENDALAGLDEDERQAGVAIADPSGTKYAIVISEPGVYRLVFRSRKPAAERFKRWLAHEVLPALRREGRYEAGDGLSDPNGEPERESLLHRLQLIREARALFGRSRAAVLWRQLGLPAVPPPPPTALDESRICLRHLLDSGLGTDDSVRGLVERALEEDGEARLLLCGGGLRPVEIGGVEGFIVANRHEVLERVFKGTAWSGGRWMRVLRRLPGTDAVGSSRFQHKLARATFIPAHYLDEDDVSEQRSILLM